MSRIPLTLFLCRGKDCCRAWRRIGTGSPGKWLKRHVEEAGLPYKLKVIKTECMDRCEQAACLCCVHGDGAAWVVDLRDGDAADEVLAALRALAEAAAKQPTSAGSADAAAPAAT